jgi:hypothetical protein
MARAVAGSIIEALAIPPEVPSRSLKLGDPGLLALSMKDAAGLFGRSFVPLRRDRKSGATKRKQHEIEAARAAAR